MNYAYLAPTREVILTKVSGRSLASSPAFGPEVPKKDIYLDQKKIGRTKNVGERRSPFAQAYSIG